MNIKLVTGAAFFVAALCMASVTLAAEGDSASGHHREHAGMGEHGMGNSRPWTSLPTLKVMMGARGVENKAVTLLPKNLVPNSVDAYASNLKLPNAHRQLPYDLVVAKLEKPESGGFYWLSAREDQADRVIVASTVYYLSERGSKNPTAMFTQQKNALEIIPQPFPREHSRYRANEDWRFLVRFNGVPVAQQKITLVTQNGSTAEMASDEQGVVTVHFPNDFRSEPEQKNIEGRPRGMRSSDFVLAAEHVEGGKTYLTGFNGSYGPEAFSNRSLAMGLGFTLLGMMGAAPLLRARKTTKKAASTSATEPGKEEI